MQFGTQINKWHLLFNSILHFFQIKMPLIQIPTLHLLVWFV